MNDYQLTKKDILHIIENELEWCRNNPDPEGSQEWNNGYVAGVNSIKFLIERAERKIKESRERFIKESEKESKNV